MSLIKTAADYMEEMVTKGNLQKARKKVPNLRWGVGEILYSSFTNDVDKYACIQGIAALASCASAEDIGNDQSTLNNVILSRFGWRRGAHARIKTDCPNCNTNRWFYATAGKKYPKAEDAVAHVNDEHANEDSPDPFRQVKRVLLRWAEQERTV
jgi:hypothetical protein